MPLSPAPDDPNRKAELERMKEDPASFGADIQKPNEANVGNPTQVKSTTLHRKPE